MRARQELGSLTTSTLASKTSMGAVEIGEVTVQSAATTSAIAKTEESIALFRTVLDELNPFSVLGAAAAGFVNGVASGSPAPTDNVNVTADGSSSISISDFKNVGGTCKPMNFPALNFAKALQDQMNRVAQAKGWGKIAADGAIGPGTVALFAKIKAAFPQTVMGDTSSCSFIAADADVLAEQVRQVADSLKAPATVSAAPGAAPSITTKSGAVVLAPTSSGTGVSLIDGAIGGMSTGQKVVLAGLVGGIGYVLYKKSKKGSKKRRG